eukprot:1196192-Prorocentrum_minimum.AAC.1
MFKQFKEIRLGSLLPFASKTPHKVSTVEKAKEVEQHEQNAVPEIPQKVPPKRRGQGPRTTNQSSAMSNNRGSNQKSAEDREQQVGGTATAAEDREQRLRRLRLGGASTLGASATLGNSAVADSRPVTSQPMQVFERLAQDALLTNQYPKP